MKKEIALSEHFDYRKLLRFTLPSIAMMIFTSIYGVVDGIFVSNIVGKAEFTAVNFIMPVLMIIGSVGFMFGAGGSALVSKTLGEGKKEKANSIFSLLVYVSAGLGVLLAVGGFLLMPAIASALGADGVLLDNCVLYGRIVVSAMPMFMLQMEFQSLFITAEKPKLGLFVTVASGVLNMILDWLFMWAFNWGIVGAALATALSQTVGGIVPIIYFLRPNTSLLHLGKTRFDWQAIVKTCTNGSSEFVSQSSMSIVSMLYNYQLKRLAGEDGVAAYGVMMYVNMIFLAIFIGYSIGTAPVIGFHFGAQNKEELKSLRKKSFVIIGITSVVMLAASEILAAPLAGIFVGYDEGLLNLTVRGFRIFSILFIFAGVNIFGSSMFTALNNGAVSALISFLRTLVFQVSAVIVLPIVFSSIDGVWASAVAAELGSFIVTMAFIVGKRKRYGY